MYGVRTVTRGKSRADLAAEPAFPYLDGYPRKNNVFIGKKKKRKKKKEQLLCHYPNQGMFQFQILYAWRHESEPLFCIWMQQNIAFVPRL